MGRTVQPAGKDPDLANGEENGKTANFSRPDVYLLAEEKLEDAIHDCLAGNADAFETIVAAYERPVFNVAFRMTGNREDARDLTQNVLLKVFQNLRSYDASQKFFSWLYRIAMNESLNLLRRGPRFQALPRGKEATAVSPEEEYQGLELSQQIQAGLMSLTEDYRTVIVLRHFRDCSYRDMAEILRIPEKTVKSRLFSARNRLKDFLRARGAL